MEIVSMRQEFKRTMPSVIDKMKSEKGGAKKVYRKMVCTDQVDGNMQGIANPRNTKQVRNVQQKKTEGSMLNRDDLYNLIQLSSHLDGFVKHVTLYPDLVCNISLPEVITQFNQLVDVKSTEQLCLSYDTTFNLGDCYVSVIVFKHILFKETPLVPLAFVIHDRKFGSVHEQFFSFIKSAIPTISKKKISIVIDREPGIRKAIQTILPDCPVLLFGTTYVEILSIIYSIFVAP